MMAPFKKALVSGTAVLRNSTLAMAVLLSPMLINGTNHIAPFDFTARAEQKVQKIAVNDQVKLGLNKSIVIDLPSDAYDILVANPIVADAVTRTARRIYLFGKAVGTTNVFVFGPKGEQIASIDLTIERDVAGLDSYLARFIEDSDITAEIINDNVVLTGTVQTPQDAAQAVALAEIFLKGGEATTGAYDNSSQTSGGETTVVVGGGNQGESRRSSAIVNLLKIVGDDQVTLKVTVAEISRSVMKQLGVSNYMTGQDGIVTQGISETITGLGKQLGNGGLNLAADIGGKSLQSTINAMEQTGVMKTLAEPTLTAVSGEQASFKVGGEFNVISASSRSRDATTGDLTDNHTISKIEYGIGLEFTPVVLSPGRISLKVRTSVSEPTTDGSINSNQTGIVSIRKRLADTTIELPSGGSMMIAGLVRDDVRQSINGIPGLKDVPVLGTLFRSRDFVRSQSELVIIVTPYLARPVARNKLAKPDDNFAPPSDGAGNFLGKVNRVYGSMQTNRKNGQYHGVVGFIYK